MQLNNCCCGLYEVPISTQRSNMRVRPPLKLPTWGAFTRIASVNMSDPETTFVEPWGNPKDAWSEIGNFTNAHMRPCQLKNGLKWAILSCFGKNSPPKWFFIWRPAKGLWKQFSPYGYITPNVKSHQPEFWFLNKQLLDYRKSFQQEKFRHKWGVLGVS